MAVMSPLLALPLISSSLELERHCRMGHQAHAKHEPIARHTVTADARGRTRTEFVILLDEDQQAHAGGRREGHEPEHAHREPFEGFA